MLQIRIVSLILWAIFILMYIFQLKINPPFFGTSRMYWQVNWDSSAKMFVVFWIWFLVNEIFN